MSKVVEPVSKIRDKGFLKRLQISCEDHPRCPSGHGQQKWVRDELAKRFGMQFSAEAVSKWFTGRSIPEIETVHKLAAVLDRDVEWLLLGKMPEIKANERKRLVLFENGAVNLVAGVIQMNGGQVAFNEDPDLPIDMFAIIGGKHYSIKVASGRARDAETLVFTLPKSVGKFTLLAVVGPETFSAFTILRLPNDLVAKHGKRKGDATEIAVNRTAPGFSIGQDQLPIVTSFYDFEATETPA